MPSKPKYEATTIYVVKLTRPVQIGRAKLLPLHTHELSGTALTGLIEREGSDAVDTAQPR